MLECDLEQHHALKEREEYRRMTDCLFVEKLDLAAAAAAVSAAMKLGKENAFVTASVDQNKAAAAPGNVTEEEEEEELWSEKVER